MEGGRSVAKAQSFLAFQRRIDSELLHHRIITGNPYTAWFSRGEQTREQVRDFIVQFSVFSNLFLIAQLFKTINADSLQGMRASKEILANEIGVVFNAGAGARLLGQRRRHRSRVGVLRRHGRGRRVPLWGRAL